MSHPFGDRISQHLHRKHGLSQAKLAEGILQAPSVISAMCTGRRLTGPQARARVLAIIAWLHQHGALDSRAEADAVLHAAGMAGLGEAEVARSELRGLGGVHAIGIMPSRPQRHHNLPVHITSFIGRGDEIQTVAARVRAHRLVTLTGAGGIGKTRLALEVGRRVLDDFEHGVWLISLAPITDPLLVPRSIVATLQLVEQPGRTPLDILAGYYEERRAMLVLDNCEHLIDACAALAEHLLSRCPGLHILATSREALRVPGEIAHRVASLSLPGADPSKGESVALFIDRAQASQQDFALDPDSTAAIARVCRQLDGIPLAIELAAAQMASLTAPELAAILDARSVSVEPNLRAAAPRHRTMRAALDWSYDLLSPDEQRLLARLSAFAGGWMMEQAEAVCADDVDAMPDRARAAWTRHVVSLLVSKSLVLAEAHGGHTRYRLLEPIRQYAAEKLVASGEADAVRHRHALAYFTLAQAAMPHVHGPIQKRWLDQLEREHDNYRGALAWCLDEAGDSQLGMELATALWPFWWLRGHRDEGGRRLEDVIAAAKARGTSAIGAHARLGLATLLRNVIPNYNTRQDLRRRAGLVQESQAHLGHTGDAANLAWSHFLLAEVAFYSRDLDGATARCQDALHVCAQSVNTVWVMPWVRTLLANITDVQGNWDQTQAHYEAGLTSARLQGDAHSTAQVLCYFGTFLKDQLDFTTAEALTAEACQLSREHGLLDIELMARWFYIDVLRMLRQFDRANSLAEALAHDSVERGHLSLVGTTLCLLGLIARDMGMHDRAVARFKESLRWSRDKLGLRVDVLNLLGLLTVACARSQFERAARLYGVYHTRAESNFRSNRLTVPVNHLQFGTYIDSIRANLDQTTYAALFEAGRAMTEEQAFAYALA